MTNPKPETGELQLEGRVKTILPGDMKIILIWTALCILSLVISVVSQSFLRLILAVPVILFIPGYVLIAALFPDTKDIDTIERLVFSIGSSIVVTPLLGLLLNFTPWGIRLEPVVISLTVFIIAMTGIAAYRRSTIPPESRYCMPVPEILRMLPEGAASRNQTPGSRIVFGIGVFAILLLIVSLVIVTTLPAAGDKFTEFFILGENRTADTYPELVSPGIQKVLYTGIGDHEYRTMNYTAEIYLVPNGSALSDRDLLESYQVFLSHNQTSVRPLEFSVPSEGMYRMEFLLFNETVPGRDVSGPARINASYRNLHLWINATPLAVEQNRTPVQAG